MSKWRDTHIKEAAHHSIMLITGARAHECCPKCGSLNWYEYSQYTRVNKRFINDDGSFHVDEGETDWDFDTYQCDDCGYDCG